MALPRSRLLLVWTTLPIAVLLSYLWYRKKKTETVQSDPDRKTIAAPCKQEQFKSLQEELDEAEASKPLTKKPFSRSLSGIDSAPIDIIFPPELRSAKSAQLIISDEDLDLEIEKIKSMKNSTEFFTSRNKKSAAKSVSPVKSEKEIERPVAFKLAASPKVGSGSLRKISTPAKVIKNSIPEETIVKTEMAQKDIVTVSSIEKKISSLKVDSKEYIPRNNGGLVAATVTEQDIHRQSTERDSANHSPVDVMLASPSLSCISDSHSEGSSDSGKGCSEVATPPSRTPAGNGSVVGDITFPIIYEFVLPTHLVGRLIGRQGTFVTQINIKTHAHIVIRKYPENQNYKVCSVEGTQSEIDRALEMIRAKFPLKRYPDVTLEQIVGPHIISTVPLMPDQLYLKLIEGINNDTIVSCMVAPNHLFLQQPTHPTFPNLAVLSNFMNACYADETSPFLPNPIPENSLCSAYSIGAWYRAIVLSTDTDSETSHLKFLDYGGYATVKNSDLRQIRTDFVLLPFQAAECFLYNIKPAGGEDANWTSEAFNLVADLTKGSIVYTQIAEYTEDEIPLVLIYVVLDQEVLFLNRELVTKGYAEWIEEEPEDVASTSAVPL